jgi:Domain of unknown function (DUF4190)
VSDVPQGPGWWQASDGRYYPPQPTAPAPPGGGYPAQTPGPYGFDNPRPQNNTKAVAAMVCGICSVVFSIVCGFFVFFLGLIPGLVAIVLGVISRNEVRRSGGRQQGDGMALAGIITGGIGVGISVLFIALWIAFWSSDGWYY